MKTEPDQALTPKKPATRTHSEIGILFKASYEREFSKGSLHNISFSGAFLFNSNLSTEKGIEHINLYIKLNNRNRKLLAKVVWKTEHGYGLKFLKISNQDKKLVGDLIYFENQKNELKQNILQDIFKKIA